jgi:hypothetical protein
MKTKNNGRHREAATAHIRPDIAKRPKTKNQA